MQLLSLILVLIIIQNIVYAQQDCHIPLLNNNLVTDTFTVFPTQSSSQLFALTDGIRVLNYTFKTSFSKQPNIVISLAQLDSPVTDSLYLSVKSQPNSGLTSVGFLLFSNWKIISWNKITISFLAETLDSMDCVQQELVPSEADGCCINLTQNGYFPFNSNWTHGNDINVTSFISGFQFEINTSKSDSSYSIALMRPTVNQSGVLFAVSVSEATQLQYVSLSFIMFVTSQTAYNINLGSFSQANVTGSLPLQIPQNVQPYYNNTLYGITGFQLQNSASPNISTTFGLNWSLQIDVVSSVDSITVDYLLVMLSPCYGCYGKPYLNASECVTHCDIGVQSSGGVCLKCPQNQENVNGTCVCTQGYFNLSGYCVQCTDGFEWNGTQCVQKILPDVCTGKPGTVWNGSICVCSQSGLTWNGIQCAAVQLNQPNLSLPNQNPPIPPSNSNDSSQTNTVQSQPAIMPQITASQFVVTRPTPPLLIQASSCSLGSFFLTEVQACRPCPPGCSACQSATQCSSCIPGFIIQQSLSVCTQICGDGLRFVLQCDDGNVFDGDGCSSICTIEPSYKCEGGSPTSKDICTYIRPEMVKLSQTGQSLNDDKVILNVKLNWLPPTFIGSDCRRCNNALLVTITQCPYQPRVSVNYLANTTYSFAITVEMIPGQFCSFNAKVQIPPSLQTPYFTGVDISDQLIIKVDIGSFARANPNNNLT